MSFANAEDLKYKYVCMYDVCSISSFENNNYGS